MFAKSGIPSTEILEIHGDANVLQCKYGINCKKGKEPLFWHYENPHKVEKIEDLPHCIHCNKICRPSVLMFNDEDWLGLEGEGSTDFNIYDYWEEAVESYLEKHDDASIVIIEVGCGDHVFSFSFINEFVGSSCKDGE